MEMEETDAEGNSRFVLPKEIKEELEEQRTQQDLQKIFSFKKGKKR